MPDPGRLHARLHARDSVHAGLNAAQAELADGTDPSAVWLRLVTDTCKGLAGVLDPVLAVQVALDMAAEAIVQLAQARQSATQSAIDFSGQALTADARGELDMHRKLRMRAEQLLDAAHGTGWTDGSGSGFLGDLALLVTQRDIAREALNQYLADKCPGPHKPVQHRDRRPPWCRVCRRDINGHPIIGP